MDKEYKAVTAEPLVVDDRTVTGLASVCGNVDDGFDIVHNGAFTKTLQESRKRFRHLWQHDASMPPIATIIDIKEIGRADLPDGVKSAYPQATGGLVVARQYLDTPRGNEVLAGIKSGAINEMSFAFDVIKRDMSPAEGGKLIRNIREVRLWETSDVVWGMNAATVASKSQRKGAINEFIWSLRSGLELTDLLSVGATMTPDDIAQIRLGMDLLVNLLSSVQPDTGENDWWFFANAPQLITAAAGAIGTASKAGRMISAANMEKLKAALAALDEIIAAAESQSEADALTQSDQVRKLAQALNLRLRLNELRE